MHMSKHTIGLLLIAVVALGAMTGVVAAAEGDLGVTVDDADGEPTVTVTENGTAVENATVNVSVVDPANESYAGASEYTTDANGTVGLHHPEEEDVTVNVTAEYENDSTTTTIDLEGPDGLVIDVESTDETRRDGHRQRHRGRERLGERHHRRRTERHLRRRGRLRD